MKKSHLPYVLPLALICLAIGLSAADVAAQSARFEQFVEASPKAGETAPDFTLKTMDGETFTLSEAYAEQPVVIEFGSYT